MSMDLELEDTMMNRYRDIGSTGSFSEKKAAEVWSQNLVETCGLSTPLHMVAGGDSAIICTSVWMPIIACNRFFKYFCKVMESLTTY
ncbi:uncharacterized protein LOC119647564 isoform X2 [Hermetia illucens]|uniref:uncharacterized protein LOC119647564 isoform X2 n=1 Tax=Hermetia illucens TaxID=343691 RepID=UPI0018CC2AA3|nr:uncharacterized protein LOC119647564 isoform X2 [Hermetia illucens]